MKCFLENDYLILIGKKEEELLNGTLEYILPLDDSWLRNVVGLQAVTV
jgi:hypothetical protein